jgi:integrase
MATRQPKGRPSIYYSPSDGEHHVFLPDGTYPNGKPRRKHIHRKTAEAVADAIAEWEDRVKQGHGQAAKIETVAQWMAYYTDLVKDDKEYATWRDVESINRLYITPHLGEWRLTGTKRRLEPEHIEAMYRAMRRMALSDSYVKRCHVILSRALKVAVRRGRADRNPCEMFDGPTARKGKPKPLTQSHAVAVLRVALTDDMAARWALGMVAGPRQGEVLGLRWHRCELDPAPGEVPFIWIKRKLQRQVYEHGCTDPVACIANRVDRHGRPAVPCRTKPCPPKYRHGCGDTPSCGKAYAHFCPARVKVPGCASHAAHTDKCTPNCARHGCPPVCPPRCTGHARLCTRPVGGLVEGDPKTDKSEAPIAVTHVVAELLRELRVRQQRACADRGDEWDPQGLVFTTAAGRPVDPRADWEAWKRLLESAGVPHSKLHAARHTAGTFLRGTGADLDMVQEQLRHVDIATSRGYTALAIKAQHEALEKAAAALFDGEIMAMLAARKGAEKVALQSLEMR